MRVDIGHVKALANAVMHALDYDDVEFGGIGIDSKRPFGSSTVEIDILEIIGLEPDDGDFYSDELLDYAAELYRNHVLSYIKDKWEEIQ